MSKRSKIAARLTGFACGIAVAGAFVAAGWTPPSEARLGAHVTMQTPATGELAVAPEGRFLEAANLEPGGIQASASGVSTITNQTAVPLSLRGRVLASPPNLDELLRVRIVAAGKRIFDGQLGGLRDWTRRSFRIQSAQDAEIEVEAWLPASVSGAYETRSAKLTLVWKTRPVEFD
jgi:hypothetical protein